LNFLESHDGQCLTTMRGTIEIKDEQSSKAAFLEEEKLSHYSENVEIFLIYPWWQSQVKMRSKMP